LNRDRTVHEDASFGVNRQHNAAGD